MFVLYVKTGCQYCAKALAAGEDLGLTFDLKNIADAGVAEELVEKGGKRQVPYLVDTDKGIAVYESDAIVAYLHENYPKTP